MTVTFMSAKIEDMKSLSWPLAAVAMMAMAVIGTLAILDKDVNVVSNVIILLLITLGIGELREIRNNTNGNNNRLMDTNDKLLDRALPPQDPKP